MKTFNRSYDGDFYAVIEKESIFIKRPVFVIGIFNALEIFNEKPTPFHTLDKEFPTRGLAENVCELLVEEYKDGYSDGQCSCY